MAAKGGRRFPHFSKRNVHEFKKKLRCQHEGGKGKKEKECCAREKGDRELLRQRDKKKGEEENTPHFCQEKRGKGAKKRTYPRPEKRVKMMKETKEKPHLSPNLDFGGKSLINVGRKKKRRWKKTRETSLFRGKGGEERGEKETPKFLSVKEKGWEKGKDTKSGNNHNPRKWKGEGGEGGVLTCKKKGGERMDKMGGGIPTALDKRGGGKMPPFSRRKKGRREKVPLAKKRRCKAPPSLVY